MLTSAKFTVEQGNFHMILWGWLTIIGGILLWLSSVAAHFVDQENALLINAIAVFLGYLVPGYRLREKVRNGTI